MDVNAYPQPETPPDDRAIALAEMAENFEALVRNEREQQALYATRNDLWASSAALGITPTEIGRIYEVQAQTVRWNLKRDASAPPAGKQARHLGRVS